VGSLTVDRHESEFGSWTSTAWTPDAGTPLAGAVVRIWYFDGNLGGARERVFPDGVKLSPSGAFALLRGALAELTDLTADLHEAIGRSAAERIVRFDRALNALAARRHGLGEIALAMGYYDQAHFTAEFREHAGLTPRAYLQALRYPAVTSILDPEQYFQDEGGSGRVEYVV
jgi:AraC-like DNA-binding protein